MLYVRQGRSGLPQINQFGDVSPLQISSGWGTLLTCEFFRAPQAQINHCSFNKPIASG